MKLRKPIFSKLSAMSRFFRHSSSLHYVGSQDWLSNRLGRAASGSNQLPDAQGRPVLHIRAYAQLQHDFAGKKLRPEQRRDVERSVVLKEASGLGALAFTAATLLLVLRSLSTWWFPELGAFLPCHQSTLLIAVLAALAGGLSQLNRQAWHWQLERMALLLNKRPSDYLEPDRKPSS